MIVTFWPPLNCAKVTPILHNGIKKLAKLVNEYATILSWKLLESYTNCGILYKYMLWRYRARSIRSLTKQRPLVDYNVTTPTFFSGFTLSTNNQIYRIPTILGSWLSHISRQHVMVWWMPNSWRVVRDYDTISTYFASWVAFIKGKHALGTLGKIVTIVLFVAVRWYSILPFGEPTSSIDFLYAEDGGSTRSQVLFYCGARPSVPCSLCRVTDSPLQIFNSPDSLP